MGIPEFMIAIVLSLSSFIGVVYYWVKPSYRSIDINNLAVLASVTSEIISASVELNALTNLFLYL